MSAPVGQQCHYCENPANTWDHIVPKSKGGPRLARWNQVPSCRQCNERKGNNDPTCSCVKCLYAIKRMQPGYRKPKLIKKKQSVKEKDLWSNGNFQEWYANFKPRGTT